MGNFSYLTSKHYKISLRATRKAGLTMAVHDIYLRHRYAFRKWEHVQWRCPYHNYLWATICTLQQGALKRSDARRSTSKKKLETRHVTFGIEWDNRLRTPSKVQGVHFVYPIEQRVCWNITPGRSKLFCFGKGVRESIGLFTFRWFKYIYNNMYGKFG